jgi:hypothetical protein
MQMGQATACDLACLDSNEFGIRWKTIGLAIPMQRLGLIRRVAS